MHLAFGGRAMLADDMGLGKTVQAIAAAALLKELRGVERVLIVTPASLKHQWAHEIRRFSSLSVTVVEGNLKARRAAYRTGAFFTILNYELVRHDLAELEPLRQGPAAAPQLQLRQAGAIEAAETLGVGAEPEFLHLAVASGQQVHEGHRQGA